MVELDLLQDGATLRATELESCGALKEKYAAMAFLLSFEAGSQAPRSSLIEHS